MRLDSEYIVFVPLSIEDVCLAANIPLKLCYGLCCSGPWQ